jgi:hypothetical protein
MEGAIYKVTLPKFVYERVIQSQRRDLAVFNADGQIVPFTVRESAPVQHVSERSSERRVPFYELPPEANGDSTAGQLALYVRTDAGGHVVSVKSSGKGESEKNDRRYLLDFSSIVYNGKASVDHVTDGEVARRELRLSLPDVELSVRLSILESANLRDWNTLLTDVPLFQLKNKSSRLSSDRIELPRTPKRYILLRIQNVGLSFELKGADYFYTVREQRSSIREESTDIEGTLTYTKDNPNAAIKYDILGAFPITKINFVLQEPGFYRVAYFSNSSLSDTKSTWRARGKMELSMIKNQDGSVRSNTSSSITMCEDRYWRVEFENTFHGTLPKMKISWRPGEVFFLAQGKAPYILAFGSHLEELSLQSDAFFRGENASVMEAEFGEPLSVDSKASEKLTHTPSGEAPEWQRYFIWGLLALGGLLLSGMAWKLMKSDTSS